MADLVGKVTVGVGYIASMNAANLGVSLAFYLLAARILTTEEVGAISLLLLLMTGFNTLTMLALNSAAVKYVSENMGANRVLEASAAFWKSFKLASIAAAASFILAASALPYIRSMVDLDAPSILLALAAGLLTNYTSLIGGAFYGLWLYGLVAVQNIIYFGVGRSSALVLAKLGLGVQGVALGLLIGASVCLLYSTLAFRGRLKRTGDAYPIKPLLGFSLPLYAMNMILFVQGWLDIALLYKLTDDLSALGVYYLVVSSIYVLTLLPNSLASVLFPTMGYKVGESGVEKVKAMLDPSIRLSLLMIAPISFGLAATSSTALTIVYGAKYAAGAAALTITSIAAIPLALHAVLTSSLQAVGYTKPIALAGLASISVDAAALALAVPMLAGVGAALARALMAFTGFTIIYLAVRRRLNFRLKGWLPIIFYALLTALPLLILDRTLKISASAKGLIELGSFLIVAAALMKALKLLSEPDRCLIEGACPRMLKPLLRLILH
ncbi:MAG: oligosaccharide flippase family protein [Candidatus Bathyarchaeia archaeon]